MHLIETRDLVYTYPGNVTALHSLNFVAPRNARIAKPALPLRQTTAKIALRNCNNREDHNTQ